MMTIWQIDQGDLQATLIQTHLTWIPQNLLWNGKAPGLVSKTQSKVDLPSLTLLGPSISAPLASSAYTCLQLRGLRLQWLQSGNIHLGMTSAKASVHCGQKSFYLWARGYSELGIFQEKKNHRGHLIQVSNSLRKKKVSGGMSTIALKLFAGEREEKAREREVPGYTVWLPAQPAVTYFQIKYTKSWNTQNEVRWR